MSTYTATPDGALHGGTGHTDTLDDVMGLDAPPVRVEHAPNGDVLVTTLDGQYVPESLPDDVDARELADIVAHDGWELVNGYSGQHGYRGPVMHASEYIGGRLAAHILATPGDYAVATVYDLDTGEPSGWVVLFRESTR